MFYYTSIKFNLGCRIFNAQISSLRTLLNFVPSHKSVTDADISKFCSFIKENKSCLVVTGAGISTESGIPDYRSEGVGLYATSKSRPVNYRDFLADRQIRQRYWARNFAGWPTFSQRKPNLTHQALKMLEENGIISHIITQNVDRLHTKAGNERVIELHGSAYRVICLNCEYSIERQKFQEELLLINSRIMSAPESTNPDGDVTLPEGSTKDFVVPSCPKCTGILKPDIVFFGDNVPLKRTQQVKEEVEKCESLMVLGSSLTVYSSYRIILQASELKKPVIIVNIGNTRGDELADVKLEVRCGELFDRTLKLIFH